MPIIGWDCPACKQRVPLDHFATTNCGLAIHPDYAQAIIDDRARQRYDVMDTATVTGGLGCPRSRAIEDGPADIYVNPLDYNALLIGQAWDTHLSKGRKMQLRGVVAGIPLQGEIDSTRQINGELVIEDHKHTGNFHYKFLKQDYEKHEAPKMEFKIQTALYAELYEQMHGVKPVYGVVWYHFSGANKSSAPSLMPMKYSFPDLATCLAHKPYGGAFTVEQLLQQAHSFVAGEVKWSDLPLAGESMSFGTKEFCSYCQVYSTCMEQAKGAAF